MYLGKQSVEHALRSKTKYRFLYLAYPNSMKEREEM